MQDNWQDAIHCRSSGHWDGGTFHNKVNYGDYFGSGCEIDWQKNRVLDIKNDRYTAAITDGKNLILTDTIVIVPPPAS